MSENWPEFSQEEAESERSADERDQSAELDGFRIRQLATLRRSAYRSRSHAIVAMLVCVGAVVQAGFLLVRHVVHFGWGWRPMIYCVFIVGGAEGLWFFGKRAISLHREAKQSRLESPATPPDFSTLGDGSQRWKNLDELR